jgi:hypothetical protein
MRSSVMAKPGSWYKCCPLDLVLNNHMQIMTMTNPISNMLLTKRLIICEQMCVGYHDCHSVAGDFMMS